ncbi:MAG: hypothetical protein RL173_1380 [Fibrobacterota bacterium]|jgi:protein arginine kinase
MKSPAWISRCGMTDPVLSARVRLARNFTGIPFRGTISPQEGRRFCERVLDSVRGLHPAFAPLADETSEEAGELVERMRIPSNLTDPSDPGPWLAMEDSGRGLLVLDGDHLRLWATRPGNSLLEALEEASRLESSIRDRLPLSRDPEWGWRTASPGDVGSGLRASLLLQLPALWITGRMAGVVDAMETLEHPLRGPWGPVGDDDGGMVIITHVRTMGALEVEIASNLAEMAAKLVREEEKAMQALLLHWGSQMQDAVARSVAVLGAARLLSRRELSSRLRWICLGARLGWIPQVTATAAMDAFLSTGNRRLERLAGSAASEFEGSLDEWRARETVRILSEAGSEA